jgi:hypothetical protein
LGQETPGRAGSNARASGLAAPALAGLYVLALCLLGAAALRSLVLAHADRMESHTGRAEWIWYSGKSPRQPRALRFYATREFELPSAPARALVKLFVDRGHVLFVNGQRAGSGSQRPGDPMAVYDVAALLRPGWNRIAIEAESPTGAGGLLFALDVAGFGRNALVSDGLWRVDPSPAAIARGGRYRPRVWGRPPQYPWGYPRMPRPDEVRPGIR